MMPKWCEPHEIGKYCVQSDGKWREKTLFMNLYLRCPHSGISQQRAAGFD